MVILKTLKFKQSKQRKKGASLVLVIVVFVVTTILLFSMSIIFNSNLKQATYQQKKMTAHYLALSGVEATRTTLLMPVAVVSGKDTNMIEYIKMNPNTYPKLEDSITVDGNVVNIIVDYDKDSKIIYITSSADYEDVNSTLKLRMDVKTEKYREFWE